MDMDYQIGEVVQLRKPHPCGSYEWQIVRLGADIGLECILCKRRILLARRELTRRIAHGKHRKTNLTVLQ